MKRTVFVLMMMFVPVALAQELETTVEDPSPSMAHVSNSFSFTVDAPLRDAAPLFGPEGERAWAGEDWKPQFVSLLRRGMSKGRCSPCVTANTLLYG